MTRASPQPLGPVRSGLTADPRRRLVAVLFGGPAAVLLGMWLWLALAHGTVALGGVVVHESGRYTLMQTVFSTSHFAREIPIDLLMALFIVAAAGRWGLLATERAASRQLAAGFALAAAAVVLWSLANAAATNGWSITLEDLLQFRTRDGELAAGSHWHNHFLSTLWFGVGTGPALGFLLAATGLAPSSPPLGHRWANIAAWAGLAAATGAFGLSSLTWTSVRYTGHQARELMTHVPVTLLLAWGCILLLRRDWPSTGTQSLPLGRRLRQAIRADRAGFALAVLIPVLLAVQSSRGDLVAEGQNAGGLVAMVPAHFFEHSLDYVFTILVVSALAAGVRPARATRSSAAASSRAPRAASRP